MTGTDSKIFVNQPLTDLDMELFYWWKIKRLPSFNISTDISMAPSHTVTKQNETKPHRTMFSVVCGVLSEIVTAFLHVLGTNTDFPPHPAIVLTYLALKEFLNFFLEHLWL